MSRLDRDHLTILKTLPLFRAVGDFILDAQARRLSPRTIDYYQSELRWFTDFMAAIGVKAVEDVEATHLRRFILALGDTRNAGGVHANYRAVRAFLRWYQREYETEDWRNPIERVRPPKQSREPLEPASLEDIRAMLKTICRGFAGDRDKAIIMALLDTGCRASEFVAVDVGHVCMSSGAVTIRAGKGGKSRVVFLSAKTRRELGRYMRHRGTVSAGDPLWVTYQGGRLTYAGLRQIVRRRAESAGVPVPSLHSFRRAFALLSLRSGMDVYSLQKLMGHSDLSVLRRYLALCEGDLRAAHAKSSPVDAL